MWTVWIAYSKLHANIMKNLNLNLKVGWTEYHLWLAFSNTEYRNEHKDGRKRVFLRRRDAYMIKMWETTRLLSNTTIFLSTLSWSVEQLVRNAVDMPTSFSRWDSNPQPSIIHQWNHISPISNCSFVTLLSGNCTFQAPIEENLSPDTIINL